MSISLPHDHGHSDVEELLARLWSDSDFKSLSELFSLLGDSTRLRLFWILCHSEECVINLSAIMDMSSPAISHHLKLLKSAELIVSRREGKEVYYRAADSDRARLLHDTVEHLASLTCPNGTCRFKEQ